MRKSLHPDLPIREWPFEDLVRQYDPLIAKYSRYNVPNHDFEDIRQEMLIVLHSCQTQFDPRRGVSFYSYLNRAFHNMIGNINTREVRKHGKNVNYGHAPDGDSEGDHFLAIADSSVIGMDLIASLTTLSDQGKAYVRARINGDPLHRVMSRKDAEEAKREIERAIPRGG